MRILHQLCSIPTAPFVEQRVYDWVEKFARSRSHLRLTRDAHGNRLLELAARSREPRLVFVAHTDHPGMVSEHMIDRRTLEARFFGGVLSEYVHGARVRFFDGRREVRGTVTHVVETEERKLYPSSVRVRIAAPVSPGSIGMFDLAPSRVRGGKFQSRLCDDLAGAAAALEMLDRLARKPPKSTVAVLLTRAEEVGFIGAIAAAQKPKLLRRSDRIISIECSAEQPYAQQGNGVILRVGDRVSVFNSALMYFMDRTAEDLAKRDRSFKFQRCLMPGGACEATVFDAMGYITGAACVPLGNYHNMDRKRKRIAEEYVDVNDWKNMVKLFVALAGAAHTFKPGHGQLRSRLNQRFETLKGLLSRYAGS